MFTNFENPLHHVMHVILIISDLDTCLYLASYYRRSSVLIISHSRNFIVEKLINCCVFHSNFFLRTAAKTRRNMARICIALWDRSFSISSKVFWALIISFCDVFLCLKSFRDDFCCSLSERIGAEFYPL